MSKKIVITIEIVEEPKEKTFLLTEGLDKKGYFIVKNGKKVYKDKKL